MFDPCTVEGVKEEKGQGGVWLEGVARGSPGTVPYLDCGSGGMNLRRAKLHGMTHTHAHTHKYIHLKLRISE